MPLSIEEVKKIERKKGEEKDKVIEFFKKQKKDKDGATDFFNSHEISQRIDISEESAADILEAIYTETLLAR